MDHFCPWVAGIVSETSFKFFIQFTGWGGLYCLHTLIAMAYFFAKRREEERGFINVHWILVLVLAGLFFLFGAGMCGSSLQFAFLNSTTIENFTRKTKIWYVAVLVPGKVLEKYVAAGRSDLRLITYPRPSSEQAEVLAQAGGRFNDGDSQQSIGQGRDHWDSHPHSCVDEPTAPEATYNPNTSSHSSTTTTTFPSHPAIPRNTTPTTLPSQAPLSSQSQIQHRTFAILATTPGANPFDLGAFQNFKQVMGHSVIDWILPIRESPVTDHSSPHSMYPVGPVVETLVRAADVDGWMDSLWNADDGAKSAKGNISR
jgi:palmitoyltransferase